MSLPKDGRCHTHAPSFNLPPDIASRLTSNPGDPAISLDAAEHCARHGLASAIPQLLEPIAANLPPVDSTDRVRYLLLRACGESCTRNYAAAEETLSLALSENTAGADLLYELTEVKRAMKEFQQVVETATDYLALWKSMTDGERNAALFCLSSHRARVYTWLGEALLQLGQDDEAARALRKAVTLDSGAVTAYVALARTLIRRNCREEAGRIIAQGLELCHEKQELVMVRDYLLNRPTISACMIVRNEEKLLPGCLESIRDWVNEIIVVDTGSTDRTIDIAREYGARIFEQPWADDFSRHRNYSIEQASCDWIFVIDADERFMAEDVPLIIDAMREGRAGMLLLGVYNVYGEDEQRVTFANSIRFFRRNLNLRYCGTVHNELVVSKDQPVLRTRARLKHLGYDLPPDQMKAKFQRTRKLLEKQLEASPDDVFALFNYAELLRGVEPVISEPNAVEVIRAAQRVVDLVPGGDIDHQHLRLMALNQLAAVHISRKDFTRARDCCLQALEIRPDYLDGLIHLGFTYYGLRDFAAAIEQFQHYLEIQARFDSSTETAPIILSYPDARDMACHNLGGLYELTGDPVNARRYYVRALDVNPRYKDTAVRLAKLCSAEGDFEEAERWYKRQLSLGPNSEALTRLASVYFTTGRYDLAEAHLRRAIGQYGTSSAVENDLGNCLYKQRRFGEAQEHYLRAVQLSPLEPLAFRNLALAQIQQGFKEEPLSALVHYMEYCPDDPAGWRLMADLYRGLGDSRKALDCYENALRLTPDDPDALFGVAESYFIMGHKDAAALGYRKLLESDPQNQLLRARLAAVGAPVGRA